MRKNNNSNKLSRSRILRFLFLVIGSIALALGTIGIFLPILPTVPFYLLTTFCYVRGSERFANWFLNSRLYKKHMENFVKNRVMVIYSEMMLLVFVTALLLLSLWFINKPVMSIVFACLVGIKYLYFVTRITPVGKKEYERLRKQMEETEND